MICLSESALLLSFEKNISDQAHDELMQVKYFIDQNPFKGFKESVPAYNSLTLFYNPLEIERSNPEISIQENLIQTVKSIVNNIKPSASATQFPKINIPVCYDLSYGIDLEELSATLKLSVADIIELHSSKLYKVYMLGFTPGFAYMGSFDEKIITQRKKQPRLKVEAGSVAIAGNQTGIYPLTTPGGWNIIGKTPMNLFDKSKKNPFLLKAGDRVKFIPITKKELQDWQIK
jgi:inhibitor of KinA